MSVRIPSATAFGVAAIAFLAAMDVGLAQQAPVKIETVFPSQTPRGQSTVINVAFPGRDLVVQSADISPATGISVSAIKRAAESQGIAWWELTIDVGRDAAPGNRTLALVMPTGRTLPVTITIPSHTPSIADLRIVSPQTNQPTLEFQFTATDASNDLGELPYVWFTTGCGGMAEPLTGVVKGKASAGVVRGAVPNPRASNQGSPAVACDLRVRATDSGGIESNTLKTVVEFAH